MEDTKYNAIGKSVLIFEGDIELESVDDRVVALGHSLKKSKLVFDPPDNLEINKELMQFTLSGNLLAILVFLSKEKLYMTCLAEYRIAWSDFLNELKKTPSLIFIDDKNLQGDFTIYSNFSLDFSILLDTINSIKMFISDIQPRSYILYDRDKYDTGKLDSSITFFNYISFIHHDSGTGIKIVTISNYIKDIKHIIIAINEFSDEFTYEIDNIIDRYLRKYKLKNLADLIEQLLTLIKQFESDVNEKESERIQNAKQLFKIIQASGVEIAPYKTFRDISIRVHHFLDEVDKGILLHLYVPKGRYQEDQLASFLRLFENYLQSVEKLDFFIDTKKTLHGQLYEFKSKNNSINLSDMEVAFTRFENFMSLCQNDLKSAETLLLRTGINSSEANRLLTKYIKEYQRLLLDMGHERERKMLDLRQRLENEAFEPNSVSELSVSHSVQPSALLSLPNNFEPINITISNSSVSINPGLQSFVEQAIYGDIHYNAEDKELLHLFEKYAERLEVIALRSELERLKDTSTSETERKTGKQKIVGFLSKVAPAIGQSALTVLTAYLEKILTGA